MDQYIPGNHPAIEFAAFILLGCLCFGFAQYALIIRRYDWRWYWRICGGVTGILIGTVNVILGCHAVKIL